MLCRVEYEGANIHTCPDCKGEWVGGDRLRAIERRREVAVDPSAAHATPAAGNQPEVRRTCPKCLINLGKFRYGKARNVVIDQCEKCKGIWLDDGELEAVQAAFEQWQDQVQGPERPRAPAPSRVDAAASLAHNLERPSAQGLIGRWMLSLVILIAPGAVFFYNFPNLWTGENLSVYCIVWLVVLLIGYYVEFMPDTGDMGIDLGVFGHMDDPFSYSDDWNRFLYGLQIIFIPPKFVANTFADTFSLLRV